MLHPPYFSRVLFSLMLELRSDEPTLLDQLDRVDLVRRVGDLIAGCEMPHVFGVHGDWGAGKTSFLHQIQLYLTGECPQMPALPKDPGTAVFATRPKVAVTVVWFEAWRYQHEAAPVVALLQEIRSQLSWGAKLAKKAAKVGEVAIRSALLAMEDLTKKIYVQASKIQEVGDAWERNNLAVTLPSHVIRDHLQAEISTLLGGRDDARLVVIVDDLDRCASDAAYRLLEGIKIYLNLPSCVFVLGMNQKVIEDAIMSHLPKSDGPPSDFRAREYLEKLCQTIVHLPIVREPAKLLDSYLQGVEQKQQVLDVVRTKRPLPANPRKIKAFANIVRRSSERLANAVAGSADKVRTANVFVVVAVIYYFHPDIFRVMEAELKFYEEIRRWAAGNATGYEMLHRLRLPNPPQGAPVNPADQPSLGETYLDPGEPTTFRAQKLVIDLGPVTTTEIEQAIGLL
jgi:hypothetical protein